METYKIVINALFYTTMGVLFIALFNAMINEYDILQRLNRKHRIMARLVILFIWPILFVALFVVFIILILNWLWTSFTK